MSPETVSEYLGSSTRDPDTRANSLSSWVANGRPTTEGVGSPAEKSSSAQQESKPARHHLHVLITGARKIRVHGSRCSCAAETADVCRVITCLENGI